MGGESRLEALSALEHLLWGIVHVFHPFAICVPAL
jgi:hypothetical protein